MSIAIDVDRVTGVLMRDGWHEVVDQSFYIDSFDFIEREMDPNSPEITREQTTLLNGGQVPGMCATGAAWKESDGTFTACPFTSILAVKFLPIRRPARRTPRR